MILTPQQIEAFKNKAIAAGYNSDQINQSILNKESSLSGGNPIDIQNLNKYMTPVTGATPGVTTPPDMQNNPDIVLSAPNEQPPTKNAWANWLPLAGGVAGAIIGTPADLLTGPAGTGVGAAGGAALGDVIKNLVQGKGVKPVETAKEAATQGVAAATGEAVLGPLMGAGAKLATKLPVIGPLAEAGAGAAEKGLAKIFGVGSERTTGEGLPSVVDTMKYIAKKFGLNITSGNEDVLTNSAIQGRNKLGQEISDVLSKADNEGKVATFQSIEDAIRSPFKKLGQPGIDQANQLVGTARQTALDDAMGLSTTTGKTLSEADSIKILQESQSGQLEVSPSTINKIKQDLQANINYNLAGDPLQNAMKGAASKVRNVVEDTVGNTGNIKILNQHYQNAVDAIDHLQAIRQNFGRIPKAAGERISVLGTSLPPLSNTVSKIQAGQQLGKVVGGITKFGTKVAPQAIASAITGGGGTPAAMPEISAPVTETTTPTATNAGQTGQQPDIYPYSAYLADIKRDPAHSADYADFYKNAHLETTLSATEQTRHDNLQTAFSSLDAAETNLVTAGGAKGPVGGALATLPLIGQFTDPQGAAYHATKVELATQLAKAITGNSRPATAVIDRYLHSLPDVNDVPKYAQAKIDKLRSELVAQAKSFNYSDLIGAYGQ